VAVATTGDRPRIARGRSGCFAALSAPRSGAGRCAGSARFRRAHPIGSRSVGPRTAGRHDRRDAPRGGPHQDEDAGRRRFARSGRSVDLRFCAPTRAGRHDLPRREDGPNRRDGDGAQRRFARSGPRTRRRREGAARASADWDGDRGHRARSGPRTRRRREDGWSHQDGDAGRRRFARSGRLGHGRSVDLRFCAPTRAGRHDLPRREDGPNRRDGDGAQRRFARSGPRTRRRREGAARAAHHRGHAAAPPFAKNPMRFGQFAVPPRRAGRGVHRPARRLGEYHPIPAHRLRCGHPTVVVRPQRRDGVRA